MHFEVGNEKGCAQGDLTARTDVTQQEVAKREAPEAGIESSATLQSASTLGVSASYPRDADDSIRIEDDNASELISLFARMDQTSRDALILVARNLVAKARRP